MNKIILILLIFVLSVINVKAQNFIDTVSLPVLLNEFNNRNVFYDPFWEQYHFSNNSDVRLIKDFYKSNSLPDSLPITGKTVGDFNGDGYKDLLLNLSRVRMRGEKIIDVEFRSIIVLMDKNSIDTCIDLNPKFSYALVYSKLFKYNDRDLIVSFEYSNRDDMTMVNKRIDTLQYFNTGFINFSNKKIFKKVKEISYFTSSSWASRLRKKIWISEAGFGKMEGCSFMDSLFTYAPVFSKKNLKPFWTLVNAANTYNLEDNYSINNTSDLSTAYLTITYSDGTVKKIEDYGMYGNFSLRLIYSYLHKLMSEENWILIDRKLSAKNKFD